MIAQVTLTRFVKVLFKNILYSLQILTNNVPKAIATAKLPVHTLACVHKLVKQVIISDVTYITNCCSGKFRHIII